MSYDEFDVFPLYFGGHDELLPALVNSISEGRGSGLTKERDTAVFVENVAVAAELYCCWETNKRLGSIWDPMTCPEELVPRWETICAIPRNTDLSMPVRRQQLQYKRERIGRDPDIGYLTEVAQRTIGDAFVQFETIDQDIANIHVPDVTYPWGTVVPGIPWSSSSKHLLALVVKPANYTEAEFYDLMGALVAAIDPLLDSWSTFDWYRAPATGVAITVVGGPSQAGFYLDDDRNLNNNVFDV